MTVPKDRIAITIDPELLKLVDAERKYMNRSAYVVSILQKEMQRVN